MATFRIGDLVYKRLTKLIGVVVWNNNVNGVGSYTVDFSGHFEAVWQSIDGVP